MAARILLSLAFLVLAAGGCSSRSATFPGHSDPEVWQAMVTAAREPVYEDWRVFDNQVMVDRDNARIEIYRILRRDLIRPGTPPVRQEEDWRFVVTATQSDPPTVVFSARHAAVPAHLWREADRYFYDMRTLLKGSVLEEGAVEVDVIEPGAASGETFQNLLDVNRP